MSHNELLWWRSFSFIQPIGSDFDNYNTAKTVMGFRGGTLNEYLHDGFNLENDPEWCLERDKAAKERIGQKQKALNEKLAKEAAEKEIQNG